jgi:hypothetical protein
MVSVPFRRALLACDSLDLGHGRGSSDPNVVLADQRIKPGWIGRGLVVLLPAGGLQPTKFGSFRGLGLRFGRALLATDRMNEACWNLPLSITLRGPKPAPRGPARPRPERCGLVCSAVPEAAGARE